MKGAIAAADGALSAPRQQGARKDNAGPCPTRYKEETGAGGRGGPLQIRRTGTLGWRGHVLECHIKVTLAGHVQDHELAGTSPTQPCALRVLLTSLSSRHGGPAGLVGADLDKARRKAQITSRNWFLTRIWQDVSDSDMAGRF